ncbi:MAG: type I restriction enzyme HsdR N-terminal domain-containing protein [Saprospiraceae bacterium]|nr:type I restriction enzyme HsdR N-terminal domain-containing protein [Saprospiraceae bacterium]
MMINGYRKRFDLVIYDKKGCPWMLAECKAFDVTISTHTAIQMANYNSQLLCPYLLMTNGPACLLCKVEFHTGEVQFLSTFPEPV